MIIYLHGFRSGPQSSKVQALAAYMTRQGIADQLWCEQLSPVPDEAIAQVEHQIHLQTQAPTLVGSSLGGFYATHLADKHGLHAAVINPLVPHTAFDTELFIGEHEMLYTPQRFTFTAEHVAQIAALHISPLHTPEKLWLLAEEGDETLDYRHAIAHYKGARQTILPGGDHSFSRWDDYLGEVLRFAGLAK